MQAELGLLDRVRYVTKYSVAPCMQKLSLPKASDGRHTPNSAPLSPPLIATHYHPNLPPPLANMHIISQHSLATQPTPCSQPLAPSIMHPRLIGPSTTHRPMAPPRHLLRMRRRCVPHQSKGALLNHLWLAGCGLSAESPSGNVTADAGNTLLKQQASSVASVWSFFADTTGSIGDVSVSFPCAPPAPPTAPGTKS